MGSQSGDDETGGYHDSSEYVSFLGQRSHSREPPQPSRLRKRLKALFYISSTVLNIAAIIVLARVYANNSTGAEEASQAVPSRKQDADYLNQTPGVYFAALGYTKSRDIVSREFLKFQPDLETYTLNYTSKEESAMVRQRWQDLLPKGGGDIHIPDHSQYGHLSEPWIDPKGNKLWKVAWAHQLHCLYLIMNDFDRVIRYGPTGQENKVEKGHFQVHTNHCFDYLRQSILCTADMTLEGKVMGREAKPGTDGWGHVHVCRNRREVIQWSEERRVKDKRFIIDPGSPL